jgi:methionine-S-sulfoxide reductase
MKPTLLLALAVLTLAACTPQSQPDTTRAPADDPTSHPEGLAKAVFAGGCFWCMQPPFDKAEGVVKTIVGYCGGSEKDPTYSEVSSGNTTHREAIEVIYDPAKISYDRLLTIFWRQIDPTQADGQFADRGPHYQSAIYYTDETQKAAAEASRKALAESGKFSRPIATDILPATTFWPAEEYHQQYYLKNPDRYKAYQRGSGRAAFIERVWGDGK